jgi:5-bromo-4-chloroindolyl phosphate hydrolysis protein
VDIARDINRNDAPIIYEINGCADLKGIETVTKISIATEIIKYVENNYAAAQSSQKMTNEPIKQAVSNVTQKDIEDIRKEQNENWQKIYELEKQIKIAADNLTVKL